MKKQNIECLSLYLVKSSRQSLQYWVTCDHDNAGGSTPLFGRHTAWEIWPRHCWTATIEAKLSNTPDKYKYTGQIQAHRTNTNTLSTAG